MNSRGVLSFFSPHFCDWFPAAPLPAGYAADSFRDSKESTELPHLQLLHAESVQVADRRPMTLTRSVKAAVRCPCVSLPRGKPAPTRSPSPRGLIPRTLTVLARRRSTDVKRSVCARIYSHQGCHTERCESLSEKEKSIETQSIKSDLIKRP